ncbi:winged helix-turn-helix domain-containing protein [Streptomyces sediminimaris]|uniref:winged helix-turn-helix domain-containing protein n=1 Tax=Streptomyces sediminimaris TaxID=3383721 RepID=UPI00399B4C3B
MTVRDVAPRLDAAVQHPTRLAVVAFLSGCAEADFKTVRDSLEMSDSALSKTVSALEAAEYVKARKGFVGKRPRTWLSLTADGRARLAAHLKALQQIADLAQSQGVRSGEAQAPQ